MKLFLGTAALVASAVAARPVFLQAIVDGSEVGVKKLDDAVLKSMNVGVELLEKFLTPDLAPFIARGNDRIAEGEDIALMLLTPLSSGSFVMNPVRVGESAMSELLTQGKTMVSDVAQAPLLEVLPGVMARMKEGVHGLTPEIVPLVTEDAVHDALETALSSFIGGGIIGSNFIANLFRVAPIGRQILDNTEL